MFSFEIASQVTWNSLPILPSIFGLSSQNIVIPHYSCHSAHKTDLNFWIMKGYGPENSPKWYWGLFLRALSCNFKKWD